MNALIQVQLQHDVICCCGPGPAGALRGYGAVRLSQRSWRSPRSKTNQYINLNRRARSDCIVNIVDWVGPWLCLEGNNAASSGTPHTPCQYLLLSTRLSASIGPRSNRKFCAPLPHSTAVGTEAIWTFRLSHHPLPGKQGKHCYHHVHIQTEVIKFNKL